MKYLLCFLLLASCATVTIPEESEPKEDIKDDTCIEGCGHMYAVIYDYGGKIEPICLCSTRPPIMDIVITASSRRK